MTDPELKELFTDPADREVVELLKASRPSAPPLDPNFRNYLRTKLMAEARRTLPPRERVPGFTWRMPNTVLALAAVAAGFVVVLGISVYLQRNGNRPGAVVADIRLVNNKTGVAIAEPIKIPFSGPVDQNAVQQTVQIEPATDYTTRWDGQTLVIVPSHPLAANTSYTVTLKPAAAPQPNQPAPVVVPVVVHFVTVQPTPPPVVPPSYNGKNLVDRGEAPITDPGVVSQAVWTPDGQLLVTRAAGASQSPSGSASPTATSVTGTDIWLMSAKGTLLRRVAAGGSYPAAAPSGGLFAFWRTEANQSTLRSGLLDASRDDPPTIATIDGAPDRAPVWVGSDRLAYLESGKLRIVDLHGTPGLAPSTKVSGSLAASADGKLLAAETAEGAFVYDLVTGTAPIRLSEAATAFAWSPSPRDDLAFVVEEAGGPRLMVLPYGKIVPNQIYAVPVNRTWTDLNWSPDSQALLFGSRPPANAPGDFATAYEISADGNGGVTPFGSSPAEYAAPRWSPSGTMVLFSRTDEGGGSKLWIANVTVQPSPLDIAQGEAVAEVGTFMEARLHGNLNAAQAELGPGALSSYQDGRLVLASPSGLHYARWYVVSVQLNANQLVSANQFLIGVRLVLADAGHRETSYVEEQLTVAQHDQKFLIDDVTATSRVLLGKGPTVVSVQVQQNKLGQLILVQFDSDLDPTTISASSIFVRDEASRDAVEATPSFDRTTHLVTLQVKLKHGTYTLVVTTAVADVHGHTLAQEYDYSPILGD